MDRRYPSRDAARQAYHRRCWHERQELQRRARVDPKVAERLERKEAIRAYLALGPQTPQQEELYAKLMRLGALRHPPSQPVSEPMPNGWTPFVVREVGEEEKEEDVSDDDYTPRGDTDAESSDSSSGDMQEADDESASMDTND